MRKIISANTRWKPNSIIIGAKVGARIDQIAEPLTPMRGHFVGTAAEIVAPRRGHRCQGGTEPTRRAILLASSGDWVRSQYRAKGEAVFSLRHHI